MSQIEYASGIKIHFIFVYQSVTVGGGYGCEVHTSQTISGSLLRRRVNLLKSIQRYGAMRYAKNGEELFYK